MAFNLKISKSLLVGIIYLVAGTIFFMWAQRYAVGSLTQMGPGYFPAALGLVLATLGGGCIVQGFLSQTPDPVGTIRIEPFIMITASVISFALLIERAGMVVATFACVFLACFRRALTNPVEVFGIFVALAAFNYVAFSYALGMNFPIFWWN